MLGLGRRSLRKVATDERGRMRADALRDAIKRDIEEGAKPFCINATCGTTVLGAYDPLDEIADVAEEFGIWFHVDGAFGGSTALSAKHRDHLKGSERSDSFTWDAHKMMGVPLSCSVILTKNKGLLRKHFSESASYLFQSDEDELNHGVKSMQCGRRNDCLKLWAAWQHLGDEGYAQDRSALRPRAVVRRAREEGPALHAQQGTRIGQRLLRGHWQAQRPHLRDATPAAEVTGRLRHR
ncbi:MAG: pyridoxal phosphate-dependent decarboxylase family protein [Phycisphaerales bacterium]